MSRMIATRLATATALAMAAGSLALAGDFTTGTVKKLDEKTGRVTLSHEELKTLQMPAMTMVFQVSDKALLDKLKVGEKVEFVAERVKGKLTVTQVK